MSLRSVSEEESAALYPTPRWAVRLILERLAPRLELARSGVWLEPSCGDGSVILAADEFLRATGVAPTRWFGVELEEQHAAFARRHTRAEILVGDALKIIPRVADGFDVAIGNNPFPLAVEIVRACLECCDLVINLQRLDWMESKDRRAFFVEHPPEVYVLPDRPRFVSRRGKVRADSGGYAWFVWSRDPRFAGRVEWLPTVPRAARAEHRHQLGFDELA